MNYTDSAFIDLTHLIQSGDMLTITSGGVFMAVTPAEYMSRSQGRHAWVVAIRTFGLVAGVWVASQVTIKLEAVQVVERNGRVIWDTEGERMPVQMEMFK